MRSRLFGILSRHRICELRGGDSLATALDGTAAATSGRTPGELIADLRRAAPAGREKLDDDTVERLRAITRELVLTVAGTDAYCATFEVRAARAMTLPAGVREAVADRVVIVTGGTLCIETALLEELQALGPRRVVSVSRGRHEPRRRVPGVEYLHADIRDARAVERVWSEVAPQIVFHLAAQRDPGRAEIEVADSLQTNVLGTGNVLAATRAGRAESFVYASTGKAMRPYTPHVYAASKRIGEVLTLSAAHKYPGQRYSAARFTHVVDNSIVLERFRSTSPRGVMVLHDPATRFYTQSAREAAQLLLLAHARAQPGASAEVVAIRDLGEPAELLHLALGVVAEGSAAQALYLKGNEPGYDDSFYAGLYDPETAADISPLFNAFEAVRVNAVDDAGADAHPVEIDDLEGLEATIGELASLCARSSDVPRIRRTLDALCVDMLQGTLALADARLLERLTRLTGPWRDTMSDSNLVIDDRMREQLRVARSAP